LAILQTNKLIKRTLSKLKSQFL